MGHGLAGRPGCMCVPAGQLAPALNSMKHYCSCLIPATFVISRQAYYRYFKLVLVVEKEEKQREELKDGGTSQLQRLCYP